MSVTLLLPPTGLVRVIYASRWGAGIREDLPYHARQIVSQSIQNNRLCDVTGVLLVHNGWFVQCLEGPVDSVRETFNRIARDTRHFGIEIIAAGKADKRLFADWDMAERRLTVADSGLLHSLGLNDKFVPGQLDTATALEVLTSVGRLRAA